MSNRQGPPCRHGCAIIWGLRLESPSRDQMFKARNWQLVCPCGSFAQKPELLSLTHSVIRRGLSRGTAVPWAWDLHVWWNCHGARLEAGRQQTLPRPGAAA